LILQPDSLSRRAGASIRLARITVNDKEVNGPVDKVIVPFVPRQAEIIQMSLDVAGIPIMVTQCREEAILARPGAKAADVGINKIVIELPDVVIDRGRFTQWIIIIADCDNKIWGPAYHQGGNISCNLTASAIITDDGEAQKTVWQGRRGWRGCKGLGRRKGSSGR